MAQTFKPKFLKASVAWGPVASGLWNGLHFVRGSYGYPAPDWSTGEMRVRLAVNDYQQTVWIVEAKKVA